MSPLERDLTDDSRWEFDAQVAGAFDDMLERSIPQYPVMRALTSRLAARHLRADEGGMLVDLGCSRGGALVDTLVELASDRQHPPTWNALGLEVSEPMVAAARERFADDPNVEIRPHDLRGGIPLDHQRASAVLSVLTLQFTPIEYRLGLVADAHRVLRPGGALLLVEKVLGATAEADRALVDLYWRAKREAGYSDEEIVRKAAALEGVLVPVTARWNEDLLHAAGFRSVECYWRCLNFAGWIAVR